jgi:hypothetical protein
MFGQLSDRGPPPPLRINALPPNNRTLKVAPLPARPAVVTLPAVDKGRVSLAKSLRRSMTS